VQEAPLIAPCQRLERFLFLFFGFFFVVDSIKKQKEITKKQKEKQHTDLKDAQGSQCRWHVSPSPQLCKQFGQKQSKGFACGGELTF
jgi:hypothetical protein